MASSLTGSGGSDPFLRPDSHMALLSKLFPENQSSCVWQSTLLKHAEDSPDPQAKERVGQMCEVGGKTVEVGLLSNTASAQRKGKSRLQTAGNMKLPLSDRPAAQSRRMCCQIYKVGGKTLKELSTSPAARKKRGQRLRRKEKKEAELNLASQDIQKFVDQSGINEIYFAPSNAQSKRESYQTCEVGGRIVEVKLLSNKASARRQRESRWCRVNDGTLPPKQLSNHPAPKQLSNHPGAQKARKYRLLRKQRKKAEADGKAVEVKPLSNTASARRQRAYRLLRKQRKEAEAEKRNPTEPEPVLQSIQRVISKDESGTEVNNGFGRLPPDPASVPIPADRLGTISPVL